MKEALFYEKKDNGKVQCHLCPHECILAPGKTGECGVRSNNNGILISETYSNISALHYDPIEKKPLYHFHPGITILSIGTGGCNLSCNFCQNCSISQAIVADFAGYKSYEPEEVVAMAESYPGNRGIAFTYNEPTVFYEYMLEVALLAKTRSLNTVMVSNGYINPEPLSQLLPCVDAFNIDLKAFTEEFYKKETKARLGPVLNTLKSLSDNNKHLEITNLIIPGLNDDRVVFTEMIEWISLELGRDTVLHLSRYFPHHRMRREATPISTLMDLYKIASSKLDFVYLGNMQTREGQNTVCPECNTMLISRSGYNTRIEGIGSDGLCLNCNNLIDNIVI
jgi:pyruvate formate lyase activating enzyme